MDPQRALSWLYDRQRFGMKFGLETVRELLTALGDPQEAFATLHVAGTNGKGSVCAFLDAALRAHGHRTGLYTSPHLVSFTERIQVDGRPIGWDDVGRGVARLRPIVEEMDARRAPPTFFECVTALAFDHFRRAQVRIAVVEVGLGGRLDATNVVRPVASVITSVGLDHTDRLGTSVQAIAQEKAGIIKPGVPVVTAARREALDVVAREATAKRCSLRVARRPEEIQESWDGMAFVAPWRNEPRPWRIGMLGAHQAENAALALLALEQLPPEWGIDPTRAAQGIAAAQWPGRLEVVRRDPLALLDGAHNAPAMQVVADFLERNAEGRTVAACVAVLRDKAAATMLRILAPRVSRFVLTTAPSARSLSARELSHVLPHDAPPHEVIEDPAAALRSTFQGPEGVRIVTGSLFLVGEARAQLLRLERDPVPGLGRLQ